MELSYKSRKLEKTLTTDRETVKVYGELAKKIKQRMVVLNNADNLGEVGTLPALRLHQLNDNRSEEWSIDIHKNWRIIFKINHDPIPEDDFGGVDIKSITLIKIISVEDPH